MPDDVAQVDDVNAQAQPQEEHKEEIPPGLKKIEIPTLSTEKALFRERIVGQDEAVDEFATLLARLKSGIRSKEPGPIDIKFLAGPSGVGKTEMIYALADILSGNKGKSKIIKINGGEYQESHTIARLLGSPPGYVGYGEDAVLSQKNLDDHTIEYTDRNGETKKAVIILVDEAEKANLALHRAFLSVLDKGELQLGNNETADFTNALIFYTSNVGNEKVERRRQDIGQTATDEEMKHIAKNIFSDEFRNAFPPELRGRINDLIIFANLNQEALHKITAMKVKKVEDTFAANRIKIKIELSPEATDFLVKKAYNPSEGARALQKVIDNEIREKLEIVNSQGGDFNLHRKKIVIRLEEGDSELSFYFNEGEQLLDFPSSEKRAEGKKKIKKPETESANKDDTSHDDSDFLSPEEEEQETSKRPKPWYKQIDDFSTEPLPTPEREQVRRMYQGIMRALPHFGFTESEIDSGTSSPYDKEFNVFGMPGQLSIHIGHDLERDHEGRITKVKRKYLIIRGQTPDKKGKMHTFDYVLNNNGTGYDSLYGYNEKKRYILEDKTENEQELLASMHADLSPWIEAMNNPYNSPEQIRKQVLAIRESLISYFHEKGILPKMDEVTYTEQPSEILTKLHEAVGIKDDQKEQTYHIKVGHEYPIGEIPGMEGEWVVQFDIDEDNALTRAHDAHYGPEKVHGLGLIISRVDSAEQIYSGEDPIPHYSISYKFWENGDIQTPGGSIGRGIGVKEEDRYDYNPHQALTDAYLLQNALTEAPLPKELAELETPSAFKNWFRRFRGQS